LTEKLKNEIKNEVLNLIKTDLRKYKLEQYYMNNFTKYLREDKINEFPHL
jgi:hypothetical protein